jgi:hypothetical protein
MQVSGLSFSNSTWEKIEAARKSAREKGLWLSYVSKRKYKSLLSCLESSRCGRRRYLSSGICPGGDEQ